ncbi:MAG TPA: hypothetical protein VHD90_06770 [Phototrophicaceae bacterium]|nr:hypothetical protein [Phototrophicaceae bacterium]
MTTKEQIINHIDDLNENQLREVLNAVLRVKNQPKGEPGWLFLEQTKDIRISPEDIKLMEQAIKEEFENIDEEPDVDFDA